jgi:histone-binding protein RBBP4
VLDDNTNGIGGATNSKQTRITIDVQINH